MDKNQSHTDPLENLFRQMPDDELPKSFRFNVMQQVMAEAVKAKKHNERLGMLATILASLVMVALGVLTFLLIGFPEIAMPKLDLSVCLFYVYVGVLTLFLLFVDYKLRQIFHKNE